MNHHLMDQYVDLLHDTLKSSGGGKNFAAPNQPTTATGSSCYNNNDEEDEEERMYTLIEARSRFVLYMQQRIHLNNTLGIHRCSESCPLCYDLNTHRCTRNCEFFSYKYVYICTRTGNIHYCTPVLCDRLNQDSEYSCELTNIIHGLAVDYGKTRQSEMQYNTKGRPGGGGGVSLDNDKTYMGPAILSTHVGSLARVKEYKKRSYNSSNNNKKSNLNGSNNKRKNIVPVITNVITAILDHAMPNLARYKQQLIDACRITWQKIIVPSERYQKQSNSYTLQYHCVIVLYSMFRDGVVLSGTDRYVIAPKILALVKEEDFSSTRKLTELQIEFKNKHTFSSTSLTDCEEIFIDCACSIFNRLKEAETKMIDYLRTRALHPSIAKKCIIKVESDCSTREFMLMFPSAQQITTRKEYSDISLLLNKFHRQNAYAIHIYVDLTDYAVDPTCPPLYTLTFTE